MDMRERRNACKMLVGKSAVWLPLGRAMRTRKNGIEMDIEQGHRIWRGFFWVTLRTAHFCGRTQLQTAFKKLFDDRVSITGRCTNFLFVAGDNSPFLPKALFFRIRYPLHVDFKNSDSFICPTTACIIDLLLSYAQRRMDLHVA